MKTKGLIRTLALGFLIISMPVAGSAIAATATPAAPAKTTTAAPATPTSAKTDTAKTGDVLLASPSSLKVDIAKAMKDRVIGNPNAPVTIIEYASLTCPHCAHFESEILPQVKKQLIDTGKARLIFRDFPLDSFAMKASKVARCVDADKYFDLIDVIFKNQERWIKSDDPVRTLVQYGALTGASPDYIKACLASDALENAIVKGAQDAQESYGLKATPTFIFNNGADQFSGAQPVDKFVETVNKLIKK